MNVNLIILNINSPDPQRLLAFYRDVVGLAPHADANRESTLMLGDAELVFDSHSAVTGANERPERFLLNLFVDDLAAEQKRLEEQGVRFVRTAGREPWGGVFSTFVDPDGNYAQLVEFHPPS
jgi:predicted enzyme related to lactoylglutathione lyase